MEWMECAGGRRADAMNARRGGARRVHFARVHGVCTLSRRMDDCRRVRPAPIAKNALMDGIDVANRQIIVELLGGQDYPFRYENVPSTTSYILVSIR